MTTVKNIKKVAKILEVVHDRKWVPDGRQLIKPMQGVLDTIELDPKMNYAEVETQMLDEIKARVMTGIIPESVGYAVYSVTPKGLHLHYVAVSEKFAELPTGYLT